MNATGRLTPEQLQHASVRLSAGRIKATQKAPYLSTALLALTPKAREGLGTFAVDQAWHMYYDPALCLKWTTDEIAAVWLHEVNHVIRKHAERFASLTASLKPDHGTWNKAADAAINSDLKEMGVVLPDPDKRFYADSSIHPRWKRGMTSEELYKAWKGGLDGDTSESSTGEDQTPEPPDEPGSTFPDKEDPSGEPTQKDQSEGEDESRGSTQPSQPSDDDGDLTNDGANEESGSSPESSDTQGGEEPSHAASSGDSGEPSEEGDSGGSGEAPEISDGEPGTNASEDKADMGHSQEHGCGSAVDGKPRDYEEPEGAETGMDQGQVDVVMQETARQIKEHEERKPGSVPGNMVRAADEILDPKVDWRRLLMVKVRQGLQQVAGKHDYSYTRPSRRYSGSQFVFPGMRGGYKPTVYVVLDTSGSMTPQDLRRALSEVAGMVRRLRGVIRVVSCDASAGEIMTVKSVEGLELVGGGGTDMRVGMQVAAEGKPKPDIVIVITDGGTPWDKEPPEQARRAKYIALIVVPKENQRHGDRRRFGISQIPDFIEVVEVSR